MNEYKITEVHNTSKFKRLNYFILFANIFFKLYLKKDV